MPGTPAIAQQDAAVSSAAKPATRMEIDGDAEVIRFFIAGEEKARLDASGFHVRENIQYGGTLTDFGREGFDDSSGPEVYNEQKAGEHDAP